MTVHPPAGQSSNSAEQREILRYDDGSRWLDILTEEIENKTKEVELQSISQALVHWKCSSPDRGLLPASGGRQTDAVRPAAGYSHYRALWVELARIKECLDDPSFDRLAVPGEREGQRDLRPPPPVVYHPWNSV